MINKVKVNIYVDGANVWFTQKSLGWRLDWKKVITFLKRDFRLGRIYYYNAVRSGDEKTKSYLKGLEKLGFIVRSKDLKKIGTNGGAVYKGNFDVEMAVDVVIEANSDKWEGVVLFSGDSDFAYLAEILHKKFKKKVYVFSSNKFLSWELRKRADVVYILNKLTNLSKDDKT